MFRNSWGDVPADGWGLDLGEGEVFEPAIGTTKVSVSWTMVYALSLIAFVK